MKNTNITIGELPFSLDDPAFSGLLGDIVRAVDPYTEADPYAVLFTLLTLFGNVIGPNPHFFAEKTRHGLQLFVILVGASSTGGKGQSLSTPLALFEQVDPDWLAACRCSGLSTGQGLMRFAEQQNPKEEPRILVIEEEISGALKQMRLPGNILSQTIRHAWDGADLQTLTKYQPVKVQGAHISLIGHITQIELHDVLTSTEHGNGFANRFLWPLVHRTKLLPDSKGIPDAELIPLVERMKQAVSYAQQAGEMGWSPEASQWWSQLYEQLSTYPPGISGSIMARAIPQTRRMACLFALVACSSTIERIHLESAYAVWQRNAQSVQWIFGTRLGNVLADNILVYLRDQYPEWTAQTAIHRHFDGHKRAAELHDALQFLLSVGLVDTEKKETSGRPVQLWRSVPSDTGEGPT